MKKAVLVNFFVVLIGSLLISSAAPASESKVGFIDLQRLVNESEMGQAAAKELDQLREKKQADLNAQLKEMEELKLEISRETENMALEEKRAILQQLQDAKKAYQRSAQDAKEAVERKNKEIVAEILTKAAPVLQQVAERENYTIIIKDKDALAYLSATVDITNAVLAELDEP